MHILIMNYPNHISFLIKRTDVKLEFNYRIHIRIEHWQRRTILYI